MSLARKVARNQKRKDGTLSAKLKSARTKCPECGKVGSVRVDIRRIARAVVTCGCGFYGPIAKFQEAPT